MYVANSTWVGTPQGHPSSVQLNHICNICRSLIPVREAPKPPKKKKK